MIASQFWTLLHVILSRALVIIVISLVYKVFIYFKSAPFGSLGHSSSFVFVSLVVVRKEI